MSASGAIAVPSWARRLTSGLRHSGRGGVAPFERPRNLTPVRDFSLALEPLCRELLASVDVARSRAGIDRARRQGMRFVLASVLAAHGVAHVVGFVSAWKLATLAELPYRTTIFSGRVDVGDAGIRLLGVLWLLVAVVFLAAAITVVSASGWAGRVLLPVVMASLLLCVTAWPDTRLGVMVNVGLLLLLVVGARLSVPVLTP